MKKIGLLLGLFVLINQLMWGQTTVFSDDFSSNTNDSWTTSGSIGGSAWSVTRSGDDWGGRISTSNSQMELTNDASATAQVSGWIFASTLTSSFSYPFNSTLNLNNGIVTWNFNMRQTRTDPAGFTGGSYSVAFILAGSSDSADNVGNGYAVVLGQTGTIDPIRLVRYSEGLSSSLTNIIISNTSALTDFGAEYLSLSVTYDPSNDQWELFLRNDGSSTFTEPTTPTLISQGTATDNFYVGTPLLYMGGYWHGSTAANQTAFFDNVSVSVGANIITPIIALSKSYLSGFNYAQGSGPSAEQLFNISGRNLTDNLLITPPTDYEISTTSGSSFTGSTITLTQNSGIVNTTPMYVRLKDGLNIGTFNNEIIATSTTSANNKNLICSGSVTPALSPPLPFVEDFNYATGDLLTDHGWTAHSGTGTEPITVNNLGLTYSDYPSSNVGNGADVFGAGEDINLGFAEQNINGTSIYFSALVNVTEEADDVTGGYFLHLGNRLSPTSFSFFCARVFVRIDSSGNVNFGLSNNLTVNWISNNYSKNTTYLVIVKYTIDTNGNDEVKMWIRSSGVPIDENTAGADIIITDQTGFDVIDAIGIRQAVDIPDLVIDGIRVASSWSNAPLPVELSSFTASVIGSTVKLNWVTATEVNNYGFEIQKSVVGSLKTEWNTIGFVNGNGNFNSPKSYSYEDKNVTSGKYSYYLKQIDNDGQFEYSKAIEVDLGAPKKFKLSQNYPNPFNPATTIRFNLPEAGNAKLTIYNLLGQEIKTIVNEFKEAGVHTVNFNASELNSGMYIYKLEAGSFIQTRKMTLVK